MLTKPLLQWCPDPNSNDVTTTYLTLPWHPLLQYCHTKSPMLSQPNHESNQYSTTLQHANPNTTTTTLTLSHSNHYTFQPLQQCWHIWTATPMLSQPLLQCCHNPYSNAVTTPTPMLSQPLLQCCHNHYSNAVTTTTPMLSQPLLQCCQNHYTPTGTTTTPMLSQPLLPYWHNHYSNARKCWQRNVDIYSHHLHNYRVESPVPVHATSCY